MCGFSLPQRAVTRQNGHLVYKEKTTSTHQPMKKKTTSKSAFFNPRVLIGLCVVLVGIVVALAQFGVFSAAAQGIIQAMTKGKIITQSSDPLVPVGFDCSTIHEKGIDKQENFRAGAIMIACGEEPGVSTSTSTLGPAGRLIKNLLAPLAYGAADVDLVTGTETAPNIVQSETFTTANPDNPNQIVVAYNDSRGRNASPINISGASASTDGGATFTRLTTARPVKAHSPVPWATLLFCTTGQPGLGSRSGSTRSAAVRASAGISPPTHRIRIAGPISQFTTTARTTATPVMRITTHPRRSSDECTFPSTTSIVLGLPSRSRARLITVSLGVRPWTSRFPLGPSSSETFRSPATRLRATCTSPAWTKTAVMAVVPAAGATGETSCIARLTAVPLLPTRTPVLPSSARAVAVRASSAPCYDSPAYWRHMGWGEPAAFNHVVSLVYAQKDGSDPGNVYYIRSTDSGVTFSAPFQLNSNTDQPRPSGSLIFRSAMQAPFSPPGTTRRRE